MKNLLLSIFAFSLIQTVTAQPISPQGEEQWVDSVFRSLSADQKIAQLMVVRVSSINSRTREVTFYDSAVMDAIRRYNIGSICLFQGGPVQLASRINSYQQLAKTPLLVTIDAETGLGMRMDSVEALPRQMMLGAMQDPGLMYGYGRWVAEQCRRAGIQVNYAPVVDVNNNPLNPVIHDRSFGENKYKVADWGIQYMRGMQDAGVMASAKHFPGHGDVATDSHYDLPVIRKTKEQLDSLELFPFRKLVEAGVGSVMVGHLYVPVIDERENRATSLSRNAVTGLLRRELGFNGLVFTDALEMKGVTKYFAPGDISAESLIAGNDMLCLPADIPASIARIRRAVKKRKLRWSDIDSSVRRVLTAKYRLGLSSRKPVELQGLTADLNRESAGLRKKITAEAITVLDNRDNLVPLRTGNGYDYTKKLKVAYVAFGLDDDNLFSRRMRLDHHADVFFVPNSQTAEYRESLYRKLMSEYDILVAGLHGLNRFPANRFGMSEDNLRLLKLLQEKKMLTLVFGNPYMVRHFCGAYNVVVGYEDHPVTHEVMADLLKGSIRARGSLPVTVCDRFPAGTFVGTGLLPEAHPATLGMTSDRLMQIDSIAVEGITQGAYPGCVVLVVKDGRIAYHKAFGHTTYEKTEPVEKEMLFDLASVTKIAATNVSVMKLYDEGKLDLNRTLGDYLPWVRGSDKENLRIEDVLLHQARLKSWIPFFQETVAANGPEWREGLFSETPDGSFSVRVAESLYMRKEWVDTMYLRILQSPLEQPGKYIYSDNDFIFLGKIVEQISGMSLDEYVQSHFYKPLGLTRIGFAPYRLVSREQIVPTEKDSYFRGQTLRGDVHDPGAAMFGGVAGHAGLFGSAYDLAVLMNMVMQGGTFNGIRFFSDTTVQKFTAYGSELSRRGLGFDKPEKDNATRREPYPALSASPETFGHTGFTGTCVWADPKYDLLYIFLSNRVHPNGTNNKLLQMNIRGKIHEAVYEALGLAK